MSMRRHATSPDLSKPTIADDQSDSAGDDNSVSQLHVSPAAQQLDLPTNPHLLIISSAVRDAMDQVMAPDAKKNSLVAESLRLLTAPGSSSSRRRGDEISTTTPPSVRLRVGGHMARSPSPDFLGGVQRRIAPSALRVGATEAANTACLVASAREHLLQEDHTANDDVVSLHASDDNLSDAPRDTFTKFKEKFSNKELTGPPLLPSAAECFNLVYQENTSANDHTLILLKEELRPEYVKLRVKPTNRAIYQLKHGAMGAIRVKEKALQAAQEPLAKAMYRTMRVAEGVTSDKMDPSSAVDHCMDIVAMATNALHQIDQVRRELYKAVLPSSLKDLISCPLGDNAELFGDNLKDRQKEIVASNELSQSLAEKPPTSTSGRPPQYGRRVYPKPYARPPTTWNKYPPSAPVATTTSHGYRPSKNAYSLPRRRPAGGATKGRDATNFGK